MIRLPTAKASKLEAVCACTKLKRRSQNMINARGAYHSNVEKLLFSVETTGEETHSQNEQQIRQHTPDQRRFHNEDFVLGQGDDRHDKFDSISTQALMTCVDHWKTSLPKRCVQ